MGLVDTPLIEQKNKTTITTMLTQYKLYEKGMEEFVKSVILNCKNKNLDYFAFIAR